MRTPIRFIHLIAGTFSITLTALVLAGCTTGKEPSACCETTADQPTPAATTAPATTAPAATAPTATAPAVEPPAVNVLPAAKAIRIRAGTSLPFTDSNGNVWLADQGFADGDTVERSDLAISNTKDPGIYQAERYSMTGFSWPLPNGKYTVKLHFAETYEGVTAAGERVFSFTVQGREFKDFDVFAKAGGGVRAYVETVPIEITDGKLHLTFTPQIENPQINGIEIIPGW